MSQKDEDMRNIKAIVSELNDSQCNSSPDHSVSMAARDVWNLSAFGFAYTVTKNVPSRYLRKRALRRLQEMTQNIVVLQQIKTYLGNDTKWDSDVADKLACDMKFPIQKVEEVA